MYELGFFSPGTSTNRYLGIWYTNISPQTVVWVANRETPITDSSGVFRLDTNGFLLVIAASNNTIVWSSINDLVSVTTFIPEAELLNSGNLVVREMGRENFIWQSFDYLGDTFLPGMKLGKDFVSGRDWRLTSWKNVNDPSSGRYIMFLDTQGFPQIFEERGSISILRFGPWNGERFSGLPIHTLNSINTHEFVYDDKEAFYRTTLVNKSVRSPVKLLPDGTWLRYNWNEPTQEWSIYWKAYTDMCSNYGLCGKYGKCDPYSSPVLCSCMEGFEPQNLNEWNASVWSGGCRRKTPLKCPNGDGFQVFKNVKMPDARWSLYNRSMTLDDCAAACTRNCSCTAYTNIDIRTGNGCLMWFNDLVDVRTVDESQDLYVRLALSDITITESTSKSSSNNKRERIIVMLSISSSLGIVILILALFYIRIKKKKQLAKTSDERVQISVDEEYYMESKDDDTELSSFSLSKISKATNYFADDMKLGEGGFGPVYKGVLDDGREIAVKRLSKTSSQGIVEFKNEVKFIAKLQHRNLVKLLGYCIQGDGSMLVYEYMPNESLEKFIFDQTRSSKLNWSDRFHIIHGIARGLLYLHQDSRFKIVHRDLKASNILLDAEMNPRISDFGLARMFKEHENQANTNNIVGTLGYISPEYAVLGTFSEKSDVFSFGVLVLEIVSGKKNRGFTREKESNNLLALAWRLYQEGKAVELVSADMLDSCVVSEVVRTIHIGLLCVQNYASDRPTMSSVHLMFDQNGALPPPKQPAFFGISSLPIIQPISINDVTLTSLEPR
ncbi:G-type lectin S-receptor-like serine/threonine-protein kinase At4g27290 isoform X2 [Rutidosis leptorrhynchoides]|uniref:G-type lectin S-receptor-like serine/threonine-protein kinase At4g27290 isoform X2 n=1 Tax=Rutidosis leptorrhynchoides TaxID=125765 RepID=UPI003A9A2344